MRPSKNPSPELPFNLRPTSIIRTNEPRPDTLRRRTTLQVSVKSSPGLYAVLLGCAVAVFGILLAGSIIDKDLWMAALSVPISLLLLPFVFLLSYKINIDATGLTARPTLGWPRNFLPLENMQSVQAVQCRALSIGGVGLRVYKLGKKTSVADGGRGGSQQKVRTGRQLAIVLRSGPALLIEMAEQNYWLISMPSVRDAKIATELLQALIAAR